MPRPKAFDPSETLDKAMELFWRRGYERTSIQDLCDELGLNRGSLYDTYGGKNRLFLSCLDRFCAQSRSNYLTILEEEGPAKERLMRFFAKVIESSTSETARRRGCFITNTAMEVAAEDPVAAERVEAYYAVMEAAFYRFLQEAEGRGEIKTGKNLRQLARFLMNTKQGLHVLAKTAGDRSMLDDIGQAAVDMIF